MSDELVKEALKYSRASTKKELIEEVLHFYLEYKMREEKNKNYADQYRELLKKTNKIKLKKSSVDLIREDRNR